MLRTISASPRHPAQAAWLQQLVGLELGQGDDSALARAWIAINPAHRRGRVTGGRAGHRTRAEAGVGHPTWPLP